MKTITSVMVVILISIAQPAVAAIYKIDPIHTNARFTLDHFATSSNVGGFYNLTGEVQYDDTTKIGSVDVTIPLSSLDTGRKTFTEHLLSNNFFDKNQFPNMRFKSDQWIFSKDGKVRAIRGQLTMKGQTHPITLKAYKFNCYTNPINASQVCGGDFEGIIDRSQWGINGYLKEIPASRFVKLNIQVEAIKK